MDKGDQLAYLDIRKSKKIVRLSTETASNGRPLLMALDPVGVFEVWEKGRRSTVATISPRAAFDHYHYTAAAIPSRKLGMSARDDKSAATKEELQALKVVLDEWIESERILGDLDVDREDRPETKHAIALRRKLKL